MQYNIACMLWLLDGTWPGSYADGKITAQLLIIEIVRINTCI